MAIQDGWRRRRSTIFGLPFFSEVTTVPQALGPHALNLEGGASVTTMCGNAARELLLVLAGLVKDRTRRDLRVDS